MKKNAINEFKNKNIKDLEKKIEEIQKEVTNELLEMKMGKSKNLHVVKNKRKDIARIKTIITMKKLTQAPKPKQPKEEKKVETN